MDLKLVGVSAAEAADPDSPARRAAAGIKAGREALKSATVLERRLVADLLARLQRLRRELQGAISSATVTEFGRFTRSSLIAQLDVLIAEAKTDLIALSTTGYRSALDVGTAAAIQPLQAARVLNYSTASAVPGLDRPLVQNAIDLTGDLLSEPMQQFRNRLVARVRSAAVAGESSTTQIRSLSGMIDAAGFDDAAYKAERMVRTELGRVLSGATFDRLAALFEEMPFLRKGWRRTRDNRTRLGHIEAGANYPRGRGIPINRPFEVNVYQESKTKPPKLIGVCSLMYPLDPEATPEGRIAAGCTILCRCNAFVDFDLADLRSFSTSRSRR